jgi:hypothetical protein
MGERRMVETTLEQGRLLLDALPYPEHPEHHFVVDPDKFDFYAMDCYRHVGESTLAEMHAQEIIRKGTAPDGTERAPMRIAEAHATLGVMAARRGDLDGALSSGNAAIHGPRRSLPTLLMVASELSNEMAQVSSTATETHNFRDQLRALAHSA